MYSKRMIIFIILLSLVSVKYLAAQIKFSPTYLEARHTAIDKEMPYLIVFEKGNCDPCQWMQQNTFANTEVQSFLNSHYICVRVDIDDFDGFALKKYYEVNKLPSILIFTPKGAETQRVEQAVSAKELLTILKDPESAMALEEDQADKPKPTKDQAVSQTVPDKPIVEEELQAEEAHFAVQLGVFSDSSNARDLANKIKRISSKEVFLKQDGTYFKVYSGPSSSRREVEAHLQQLKDYGYKGFIKSVSLSSKI